MKSLRFCIYLIKAKYVSVFLGPDPCVDINHDINTIADGLEPTLLNVGSLSAVNNCPERKTKHNTCFCRGTSGYLSHLPCQMSTDNTVNSLHPAPKLLTERQSLKCSYNNQKTKFVETNKEETVG